MRLKLDENVPLEAADALRASGHDVDTALDEGLGGARDPAVLAASVAERRALVSLDLDFANIVAYPPAASAGLIVLRPARQTVRSVVRIISQILAPALATLDPSGRLWLVDDARIREHA